MAKSNGTGANSFNDDLNLLENFNTSEPINIHLEKSSPIVTSFRHYRIISRLREVSQILNGTML